MVVREARGVPRQVEGVEAAVVLWMVDLRVMVPLVQSAVQAALAALASVQIAITASAAPAEATEEEEAAASTLGQAAAERDIMVMVGMEEFSAEAAELEERLTPAELVVLERAEAAAARVEQILLDSAEPAAWDQARQRVEEEVQDLEEPSMFKREALLLFKTAPVFPATQQMLGLEARLPAECMGKLDRLWDKIFLFNREVI
jgi:hypothetical protein